MIILNRLVTWLFPDRRPEREFIKAVNSLKTLRVTPEDSMLIDSEEIREQVLESRERLKHFVRRGS